MSFRKQVKKLKKDLEKRHEEAIETKDDTGSGDYGTIFLKDATPEGMEFWRPEYGEHLIDIIPFVAGANHPKVAEGRLSYVIDLWVHQNIGVGNDPFVCQVKNFKLADAICDYIRKNRLTKSQWKPIAPKRRTVYLVWVHDTPEEEEKGLQIFEVAHFFFEKNVDAIAKNPKGGAPVIFSDPDNGKTIAFEIQKSGTYKDDSGTDRDSQAWIGHRFIDREEPIPDEILDTSFSLDDIIDMHPDENKVFAAFNGEDSPAEEETEPEETEPEQEEPEETEPEQEEPEQEEPEKSTAGECPYGAKFGIECDMYEQCEECDSYDDCSDEQQRLEEAKKKKGKKKPVAVKSKKKPLVLRKK